MLNHPRTEAAPITDTNKLGKEATYIYLQFPFPWFGHISRISLQKNVFKYTIRNISLTTN